MNKTSKQQQQQEARSNGERSIQQKSMKKHTISLPI
jgi:hypothetical protein